MERHGLLNFSVFYGSIYMHMVCNSTTVGLQVTEN